MIASSRHSLDGPRFSPDGNWIALSAIETLNDRAQILAVPLQGGKPAPESAWIAITDGHFWDDKPVWTQRGDTLLFDSNRDGFRCVWRQALNRTTRQPEGAPTEVLGFHGSRFSTRQMQSGLASLSLSDDRILFNALESAGSVWVLDPLPR